MPEIPDEVYAEAWNAMARAQRGGNWRAAVAVAFRAGREAAARDLERPGSILCSCPPRDESEPTNPKTGAAMDHHCDCRAVEATATMLGAYSRTVHAGQCIHGTEMDEFYRRVESEADQPRKLGGP